MLEFSRCRYPRIFHNKRVVDYNEINSLGHLLLWLTHSYRENEFIHLYTNETTNAGTPILLLITNKRVLIIDMVQLSFPVIVFEVVIYWIIEYRVLYLVLFPFHQRMTLSLFIFLNPFPLLVSLHLYTNELMRLNDFRDYLLRQLPCL